MEVAAFDAQTRPGVVVAHQRRGLVFQFRIADAGQPRRAVVVGHSMGGSVALHLAMAAPDRVAGLVYLDAFVPADGEREEGPSRPVGRTPRA